MLRVTLLPAALLAVAVAAPARAESSLCTEITSLPTTLSTPGVYCLKKHLTTSMTQGAAIMLAADGITLDCNGFKLGSLGSGTNTLAVGVRAASHHNLTVRDCNVRGFRQGIFVVGNYENIVDNLVSDSTFIGIQLSGSYSTVRGNRVVATGLPTQASTYGILVGASPGNVVIDNQVAGVISSDVSVGIKNHSAFTAIENNRVSDTVGGVANARAIDTTIHYVGVRNNHVSVPTGTLGGGISVFNASSPEFTSGTCTGNVVMGFPLASAFAWDYCTYEHQNLAY